MPNPSPKDQAISSAGAQQRRAPFSRAKMALLRICIVAKRASSLSCSASPAAWSCS